MNIIPFSQIKKGQEQLVGAKGASLGMLTHAGLPVPVGYVISSTVFTEYIHSNNLEAIIQAELEKVNLEDLHSVDYASRILQDLILSAQLQDDEEVEIMQQFTHINSKFAAVRSSVHSDDAQATPWAGELETFLQVPPEEVSDKIKSCWASLFSTRALYFLLQKDISPLDVKFAVIIEQMFSANRVGNAYSVHPVSRDDNQIVIEAGLGIGETQGNPEMTPDTYVVYKEPFSIISKSISKQHIQNVVQEDGGVNIKEVDSSEAEEQKLSDKQIEELSELICKVEDYFEEPTEVEWIFADQFYIVQARKISTLG